MTRAERKDRDGSIVAMYHWGRSMKYICSKTGLEWRQVYYILRKQKVKTRGWREQRRAA